MLSFLLNEYRPLVQGFEFDHHYPKSENNSIAVVLYGKIGSGSFWRFHQQLVNLAENGLVHYVLRHYIEVGIVCDMMSNLFGNRGLNNFLHLIGCNGDIGWNMRFCSLTEQTAVRGLISSCRPVINHIGIDTVRSLS